MVPVTSLAGGAAAMACGIATDAVLSEASGAAVLSDCRPAGAGEVIDGAGVTGLALLSAGFAGGDGSLESSIGGAGGGLPLSSSVIAILKVPSTITTTLAPTSSERILEVIVDGSLAWPLVGCFTA